MGATDLILAAALGAVCLAISATLWTLVQRRRGETRMAGLSRRLMHGEHEAAAAFAAIEADDVALLNVERGRYTLAAGEAVFREIAAAFGVEAAPMAVMDAVMRADPAHGRRC